MFEKHLKVINDLKPTKPSRYYCLENDGKNRDMYGFYEIALTASGAEITRIISALESKLDMEWRFADCDTFHSPLLDRKENTPYGLTVNTSTQFVGTVITKWTDILRVESN